MGDVFLLFLLRFEEDQQNVVTDTCTRAEGGRTEAGDADVPGPDSSASTSPRAALGDGGASAFRPPPGPDSPPERPRHHFCHTRRIMGNDGEAAPNQK